MRRFFSRLLPMNENGCVEWNGGCNHKGYGTFTREGRNIGAHRYSYMVANNIKELSRKQFVCHACDNPACVNPEHLWLGDAKSNMEDCAKKGRIHNSTKTHCINGHEYSEENTYIVMHSGGRECRICRSVNKRRYRLKKKAQGIKLWKSKKK